MSYLPACPDGFFKRRSSDPGIDIRPLGVIFPLSPTIRQLLHDYGFFHIVLATSFDSALAYISYYRTF